MSKHSELLNNYISSVSTKFTHEETSEIGYRTDFEILLKGIFESIKVTRFDHDAKAKQGNKPDFVVVKDDIPLLYIETKDIGISLDKVEKSEQMARYFGYTNLVLTDYLEFRFYRNGLPYGEPIIIATYDIKNRVLNPIPEQYENLANTLLEFTISGKEPIKSGKHLSKIMGGKAQRIRDNIQAIFESESGKSSELHNVYETLKKLLVHDLTRNSFADMYAQTLVYGLFVARFYDNTPETFSRQEARDLIPASNPFLGHFFDHIAGRNFEKRLSYIADELCEVFQHANVSELMERHFKFNSKKGADKGKDQVIHFYEDFLREYDDELRKKMGAFYTPLPVVQYIVDSVDRILEKEFNLLGGLANTSKTKNGLHRVQVLDPAVGTGTFISTVIGKIYSKIRSSNQAGQWPSYVHHELLPRIYGFELMMAPYTIAHLKLSMALKETGFLYFNETRSGKARLGIYLTNTLDEVSNQPELLAFDFGASIAEEAEEASKIKKDRPIMVVVGNPPYSGISSNETAYANSLVERYKVEPGGKQKLQERKHWLNDDYVKFISFAESLIEKNGDGIVAMITNNGYLDNPTFRGMRWQLAKTFDKIYLLNLHGNSKKKEKSPDGSKDENVFDIMQGVGIIFAIKTGKKNLDQLGEVFYSDLFGSRDSKFAEINKSHTWQKLSPDSKMFYFVPKDTSNKVVYDEGFSINELFIKSSTGIVTMADDFITNESKSVMSNRIQNLISGVYKKETLKNEFKLGKNYPEFIFNKNKYIDLDENKFIKITYRPFEDRWTYYDNRVLWRWRDSVSKHFINKENLALGYARSQKDNDFNAVFVSRNPMEAKSTERSVQSSFAPLYLYNVDGTRTPNFNSEIISKFTSIVSSNFSPEDIFDYIYAVLYSPLYRSKYNEFLKTDFPKIPYPTDKIKFKKYVSLGRELIQLHLLETPKIDNFITTYPISGSDVLDKIEFKNGNVYINNEQYFGNVPDVAWNFFIGGYQPAQKWLKDRKGKTLTNEDIEHYQKIIVVLVETDKIMKEIDKVYI